MKDKEDLPIGEMADKVIQTLLHELKDVPKGAPFVQTAMEVMTCCVSELIRASACPCHREDQLELWINLIKEDFERFEKE